MANNTIKFSDGYSGMLSDEDWSKYTDHLTTGSATVSPQETLNITGEVYLDPMKDLKSVYSYDDMSTAELAEEDAAFPPREDIPAELWGKPIQPEAYPVRLELSKDKGPEVYPVREDVPAELWGKPVVEKQAVRELVRRETIEYYVEIKSQYTEGDMIRRVTKTEQWFPDGEGDYTGPDNPLVSTYYEYIGGRK